MVSIQIILRGWCVSTIFINTSYGGFLKTNERRKRVIPEILTTSNKKNRTNEATACKLRKSLCERNCGEKDRAKKHHE
jgi:hypothetical protein